MFGEIVRGHRRRLGVTQEKLAERTRITSFYVRVRRTTPDAPDAVDGTPQARRSGWIRTRLCWPALAHGKVCGPGAVGHPGVESYQDWRIVADRDGLDQITPGVTTPLSSAASTVCTPGADGGCALRRQAPAPRTAAAVPAGYPRIQDRSGGMICIVSAT